MNGTASNKALGRWRSVTLKAVVKGAEWSLLLPTHRSFFVDRLIEGLDSAFQGEKDSETLNSLMWFGSHLKAFLRRVAKERPAAGRAILRFMGQYIRDIHHREESQHAGLATPSTVVIEPTDRCNLHCPGCYAKSISDGSDLSFEQLVDIVDQVVDMGISLITISGGEPFLAEKRDQSLTRLARMFPDNAFLVYTNGTLIDEATAARLGKVGNIFPAVSVEGTETQTDARRGKGISAANRTARRRLARHGVMTGFSATVTRLNAEGIAADAFIDQRIEEGDMFGWFFLLQPIGRAPRPDLMVTADQRARLRESIYRWRLSERPIFLGDFWNDGPMVGGCIAGGRRYFHICANGDISPCVFAPVACGNILDIIAGCSEYTSLNDFVQRNPIFMAYREEQTHIKDRKSPCLLIDHPETFRRVAKMRGCRPTRNMPEGYLDGEIARTINSRAAEWREKSSTLHSMAPGQVLHNAAKVEGP